MSLVAWYIWREDQLFGEGKLYNHMQKLDDLVESNHQVILSVPFHATRIILLGSTEHKVQAKHSINVTNLTEVVLNEMRSVLALNFIQHIRAIDKTRLLVILLYFSTLQSLPMGFMTLVFAAEKFSQKQFLDMEHGKGHNSQSHTMALMYSDL